MRRMEKNESVRLWFGFGLLRSGNWGAVVSHMIQGVPIWIQWFAFIIRINVMRNASKRRRSCRYAVGRACRKRGMPIAYGWRKSRYRRRDEVDHR